MAGLKFACPHCQQHIAADTGYAGIQINCPSCQGALVVPGAVAVPQPGFQAAAPPPPPPPSPTFSRPASAGNSCPSCQAALPRGAVLCTTCGYNLHTRQRTVAGRPAALGKPRQLDDETPWYQTAWPYVGAVMLILGILYFLGRDNPAMKLAFLGVAVLYVLAVHIIVIVAAFRESVGTGFLTLCIPFYALYFVFKVCESETLKILYASAVLLNISLRFALAD